MNIDLLMTGQAEAGLVSDSKYDKDVAGVMYDAETGIINLEFADADTLDLNIPLDQESGQALLSLSQVHIGAIEHGMIADSRQVPLVLINDPFGGGNAGHFPVRPRKSVIAFENFMQRTVKGQPVHREDLGDESSTGSVMGGVNPAVLQFAPHLARQRTMEATPHLDHAPQAPGMGLGGGGGAAARRVTRQQPPPRDDGDYEE